MCIRLVEKTYRIKLPIKISKSTNALSNSFSNISNHRKLIPVAAMFHYYDYNPVTVQKIRQLTKYHKDVRIKIK